MAGPVFSNNAVGSLAASYAVGATAITLIGGQGNKFPAPGAGEWFPVTVVDASNNMEVMRCTARAGDTLTVVRGQEGTGARALAAGERVEHRVTAQALREMLSTTLSAASFPTNPGIITGAMIAPLTITTGKIALGAIGGDQLFQGRFIHESFLDVGVAAANLGFTPVRQGGFATVDANTVNIGWSISNQRFKIAVDGADKGYLLSDLANGTVNSAGYRGLPQNVQNANYVFGLNDSGRQVLHTQGTHTWNIPTDAAVGYLIGTVIKLVNREDAGTVTIAPGAGINLRWLPSNSVGARVLASPGSCVIEKMDGTNWWIYGQGLS